MIKEYPALRMTESGKNVLLENFYCVGYTIPKGFKTDLASIPSGFGLLWFIIGRPSKKEFQRAAVLHDYLLEKNIVCKNEAHKLFKQILKEEGVKNWRIWCMYKAVKYLNRFIK